MSTTPDITETTLNCFRDLGLNMLATAEYSDLTLKCQGQSFKVHRVVVCPQSKPLTACLKEGWKGFETGEIILDNEPDIVAILVNFFYTQTIDLSAGATKGATKGATGETADETLLVLTKVYVIADKYGVSALKNAVVSKFRNALLNLLGNELEKWTDQSLPKAPKLMYEETLEKDRALKDSAIKFVAEYNIRSRLLAWAPFRAVCLEIGEIAVDILMLARKPCPTADLNFNCAGCKIPIEIYHGHARMIGFYCGKYRALVRKAAEELGERGLKI